MRLYIILILLLSLTMAMAESLVIRLHSPSPAELEWLKTQDIDWQPIDGDALLIADDAVRDALEQRGISWVIVDSLERMSRDLAGYPSPQTVIDSLYTLAAQYQNITQLINLGPSTCHQYYLAGDTDYIDFQYDVICLKVSDNPQDEEDEANVFFTGGIHAREAISIPVPLHILEYLLQNYSVDPQVTQWIDDNQIWFVPLINPDGYHVSWETLHTYHRKNMRDNDNDGLPDYSATDGVDLNRNFGYVWGNNGASSSIHSSIYHGPNAWSETEVCYLRDLIQARKFWGGITYHSAGEWVLYPLGHLPGACSYDHAIMGDLAVAMAAIIPCISGTGHYTPIQAVDFGYTCQGTMGDWGYAEERLFSFTLELATTYIPPATQIATICADNLQAALMFLDRAGAATVTGHVSGPENEPLVADIHVAEIDTVGGMSSVEAVRSGQTFGRYWRHLLPGSYTFTFSAQDYLPVTIENVAVSDTGRTVLDVTLASQWVPGVQIVADSSEVTLSWSPEPDLTYSVYWAPEAIGTYEPATGTFLSPGVWSQNCDEERRFYRVKRAPVR
ncbi:MAG: hypothetical protein K8R90_01165 [Candidatus Cloacimonetes bacterium]|nr:hypothetical protein [Candidatus Cloacimonadota bacterium]